MTSTSTMESSRTENLEDIGRKLFENVMKCNWEEVVSIYGKYPLAHKLKITSSGHTALHVAIDEEESNFVEKMLQHIKRDSDLFDVLKLETEKGHTPLHFAAAYGRTEKMCKICIESVDDEEKASELVRVRDKKGETPLFKAVHYAREESFLYLHSMLGDTDDYYSFCVRNDGQSILHDAIIRENFDLAFQIIHLYEGLVNLPDNQGDSPLHALARKAAAFQSGSTLRGWDRIIYHCISVKEPCTKLVPKKEVKDEAESSYLGKNTMDYATGIGSVEKERTYPDIEGGEGSNIARENQPLRWSRIKSRAIPFIFGYGSKAVNKIYKEKRKHLWADRVLRELVKRAIMYGNKDLNRPGRRQKPSISDEGSDKDLTEDSDEEFGFAGSRTELSSFSGGKSESPKNEKKETAILIAAKYGIVEMVEKILEFFPLAITDEDEDGKNVLLVAVENRHLQVYKLLVKYPQTSVFFQKVDKKLGNNALHFAATYDESVRPWPVPGAALQMQWEIKWLEFVEDTMPSRLFLRTNAEGQTPREIFTNSHKLLVKEGGKWLISMATSCSIVAALIVTVAFDSSTTVPGGTDSNTGKPTLRNNPTFKLFAFVSLIALCFSVTSLITFLAILTSRHHEKDFGKNLPRKILMGMSSLFVSIASMLVTFCTGHFLAFEAKSKYASFPIYAVTVFPLCLFAAAQFPLYFDLLRASFWSPFR